MKNVLVNYIVRNKKNFIIIAILFCIGIAIGIGFVNNSTELQKAEINDYIETLIKNIKETKSINKINLLFISIKQNVSFIILIWFLGCTIIGGIFIYVAVLYKGFLIGYTISAIIAVLGTRSGIIFSLVSMLLQNILFLPAFFIIAENRGKIV